MDFMGVMVGAEQGIVNFLNTLGQLPGQDVDFMEAASDSLANQNPQQ